jgi:hypothetical protein
MEEKNELMANKELLLNILNHNPGQCFYCHIGYSSTRDHIWPKSKGGIVGNGDKKSVCVNTCPCCLFCNGLKGSLTPLEFFNDVLENNYYPQYIKERVLLNVAFLHKIVAQYPYLFLSQKIKYIGLPKNKELIALKTIPFYKQCGYYSLEDYRIARQYNRV